MSCVLWGCLTIRLINDGFLTLKILHLYGEPTDFSATKFRETSVNTNTTKAEGPLPKGLVVPFPSRSAMLRNSDAMIANAMAGARDCDLDLPLLGIHRSRDRCVQLGRLQRERRKEHSTKDDPKKTAAQEWRCAELECGSFQHGRSNNMFDTHSNTTRRLTL